MDKSKLTTTLLGLSVSLTAQAVVSPAHFANAPGNSNGYAGVGHYAAISRHLQIHDDLAGAPRTIQRIAFRRETPTSTAAVPASTLVCDLRLSTAARTAGAPDANFAANHGANYQQVAAFQLYQLPTSAPAGATMPFEYVLPFQQPYAFDGQGPLAWEIRVHSSNNNGGFLLDTCANASLNPKPATATLGLGCKATGRTAPISLTGDSSPNWGANGMTLSYMAGNLPSDSLVWIALGNSQSQWGNLPLPATAPGTAAAPSGACSVYTNWLAYLPALTDGSGNLSTTLGSSIYRAQHGLSLFAQVVAVDPAANGYGIVLSNLLQHQIVAPFNDVPVGQVTVASNLNATGQVNSRRGAVVRFD